MMLYHNIMNSDHKRVARKVLAKQTKSNHKNTMIAKLQQITQELGVKIKNVESMSKSKLKKQVKGKMGKSIEERTKQEIINKTNARTIVEVKWQRKKYLQECDSDKIKNVIKIRRHMLQVNCNYKKDNTNTICPLCKKSEDTTEHLLEKQQRRMGIGNKDLKKK